MKRILSIDGGGIRGIVPGQILVNLERKLKEQSGDSNARLADYFDFMAGTSTGGILTCIYLFPNPSDPYRPRFSAEDAVNLYAEEGGGIFHIPFWKTLESFWGLNGERFPVAHL